MNRPVYLIVHTAAWPGDPSAAEIDRARGWRGIGYHYVIRKDGTVEAGRLAAVVGALGLRVGFDLEVSEREVADVVAGVVALVGSVVATLGRVRATEQVRR